jgi:hypothetical protein
MKAFCERIGSAAAMAVVAEHMAGCGSCCKLFGEIWIEAKGVSRRGFTLTPLHWLKEEHLEYEQKAAYANGLMDPDDREMVSDHLGLCRRCREDLESFLSDRRNTEPELSIKYGVYRSEE